MLLLPRHPDNAKFVEIAGKPLSRKHGMDIFLHGKRLSFRSRFQTHPMNHHSPIHKGDRSFCCDGIGGVMIMQLLGHKEKAG